MATDFSIPAFQRVTLDAIQLYATSRLPSMVLQNAKLEVVRDIVRDDLVMTLHSFIFGKQQYAEPETVTREMRVEYPATWWQAFKLAAVTAGNPFINPAKIHYTRVDRRASVTIERVRGVIWPDMDFPVPPNWGRSIELAMPTNTSWRWDDGEE